MSLESALSRPGTARSASDAETSLGCWNSAVSRPGRTRSLRFLLVSLMAVSSAAHVDRAENDPVIEVAPAADPTVDVRAPAVDLVAAADRDQRAGITLAGGHLQDRAGQSDRDRHRRRLGGPVSELPAVVAPPAHQAPFDVVDHGAGVLGAGRQVDRGRQVSDRAGQEAVGDGAVAELAELVVAPAVDGAAFARAAEVVADHDLVGRHADGLGGRLLAGGGRAVAELAGVVGAPAVDRAAAEDRAGVL